jgi:hypothetical protein
MHYDPRIARRCARRIHGSSARRRRPQDGQGRQLKRVTTLAGGSGAKKDWPGHATARTVFFGPANSNAQFDVAAVNV